MRLPHNAESLPRMPQGARQGSRGIRQQPRRSCAASTGNPPAATCSPDMPHRAGRPHRAAPTGGITLSHGAVQRERAPSRYGRLQACGRTPAGQARWIVLAPWRSLNAGWQPEQSRPLVADDGRPDGEAGWRPNGHGFRVVGLAAWMIAERRPSPAWCVLVMVMAVNPAPAAGHGIAAASRCRRPPAARLRRAGRG